MGAWAGIDQVDVKLRTLDHEIDFAIINVMGKAFGEIYGVVVDLVVAKD